MLCGRLETKLVLGQDPFVMLQCLYGSFKLFDPSLQRLALELGIIRSLSGSLSATVNA